MKYLPKFLFTLAATALAATSAHAVLIVDFAPGATASGGTQKYTSSSTFNATAGGNTDAFSLSNVIAGPGSSATPNDNLPRLVGGVYLQQTSAAATMWSNTFNVAGGSRWEWRTNSGAGSMDGLTFRGLFMVQQADWLTATTGTVNFDTTSSITLSLTSNSPGNLLNTGRAVVLNDGTYYVSEDQASNGTLSLSFANNTNWASFTATDFNTTNFAGLTYTPQSASFFDDIEAVGYYNQWTYTGTGGTGNARMNQFTVNAIPEPASAALLAGGVAVLVLLRRRRNA